jgi:NAD(P)-dependent dehydrogenase (short-subunit alcohol dehydrogenase family)
MFSSTLFFGCHVVITGAGRGIGLEVARQFLECGAELSLHMGRQPGSVLPPWLDAAVARNRASLHYADFMKGAEISAFCDAVLGSERSVDVLINNAGTMVGRFPAEMMTGEQYHQVVHLNQTAVVAVTSALIPSLKQAKGAAIVNTVSISALTGGSPGSSLYSASKAFVSTYSKALARELAPFGIRVNCVSPGTIDTDFHARYSSAEKLEATRKTIPLQRLGTPEDCAPAYLFLAAGSLSGYITGQVLEINGGQLIC